MLWRNAISEVPTHHLLIVKSAGNSLYRGNGCTQAPQICQYSSSTCCLPRAMTQRALDPPSLSSAIAHRTTSVVLN